MPEQKRNQFEPWSAADMAAVREHYPTGGKQAVLKHLETPRSPEGIRRCAQRLGLKAPDGRKYQNRPDAEFVDAAIRRAVQSGKKGALKELEKTVNRSYGWIKWRACKIGLRVERDRTPWTPEEEAIVETMAGKSMETIARTLKSRGFNRSEAAVYRKFYLLGLNANDPDTHTAADLARLLGVHGVTVTRWIQKGMIKAERGRVTPRDNDPVFWRIRRDDVKRFVRDYPCQVNLAKCDRFWIIELLAGPPRRAQAGGAESETFQVGEGGWS